MIKVNHKTNQKGGSFYYEENGKQLAEMVYVMAGQQMIIDHTDVDPSLKGQGIGKQLQAALVEYVRKHQIKVIPLCPFAKATFDRMVEWQDVLA